MLCSMCQHGITESVDGRPTGNAWVCHVCNETHCPHIKRCPCGDGNQPKDQIGTGALPGKFDVELPCFGIRIKLAGGAGTITSDMKDPCPYCNEADCYGDCDGSAGDIDGLENASETENRSRYNCAIDGVESLLLAMACRGIDICTTEMYEAIESAIIAIADNLREENGSGF